MLLMTIQVRKYHIRKRHLYGGHTCIWLIERVLFPTTASSHVLIYSQIRVQSVDCSNDIVYSSDAGLTDVRGVDLDNDAKNYTGFEGFSAIFIAIGVFVVVIGGLGTLGACCANRCMLVMVSNVQFSSAIDDVMNTVSDCMRHIY